MATESAWSGAIRRERVENVQKIAVFPQGQSVTQTPNRSGSRKTDQPACGIFRNGDNTTVHTDSQLLKDGGAAVQAGIIVRGFIASPSDVPAERKAALEVVTRWNAVNSLDRAMVIEAVRVESHAESQLGQHPQKSINSTLLERCDFLLAIFWTKLGTATEDSVSGTVDEITEFEKAKGGDKVKLFFCERDIPHDHDKEQFAALEEFKKEMQAKSLYIPFDTTNDFEGKLRDQLDIVMNKIDRLEAKAQLWSENAKLTELDKLEVEVARHEFEVQKQHQEDLRAIQQGRWRQR